MPTRLIKPRLRLQILIIHAISNQVFSDLPTFYPRKYQYLSIFVPGSVALTKDLLHVATRGLTLFLNVKNPIYFIMFSKEDVDVISDVCLIFYIFIVVALGYVALPKCDVVLHSGFDIYQLPISALTVISIGVAIYAHYFPNQKLHKIKSGVIAGLGSGLGIITILTMLIHCIS